MADQPMTSASPNALPQLPAGQLDPYGKDYENALFEQLWPEIQSGIDSQFAGRGAVFGAADTMKAEAAAKLRQQIALQVADKRQAQEEQLRREGVAETQKREGWQREDTQRNQEYNQYLMEQSRRESQNAMNKYDSERMYREYYKPPSTSRDYTVGANKGTVDIGQSNPSPNQIQDMSYLDAVKNYESINLKPKGESSFGANPSDSPSYTPSWSSGAASRNYTDYVNNNIINPSDVTVTPYSYSNPSQPWNLPPQQVQQTYQNWMSQMNPNPQNQRPNLTSPSWNY